MKFSRQNSGVGCHFLLQEIFPTQGLNLGLLHGRQFLFELSYQGSLVIFQVIIQLMITWKKAWETRLL